MTTTIRLAILIYAMVQGVLFGVPTILVLSIPALAANAAYYLPAIIVVSFLIAVPVALIMAPWLKARRELRNLPPDADIDAETDIGLAPVAPPRVPPRRAESFAVPGDRPVEPPRRPAAQTRRSG
jgi:hypothetical protein